MSWLITIIVGLLVGWLAGLISGSFRRFGTTSNILAGIAGAIIGYWLYVSVFSLGLNITAVNFFSGAALIWEIVAAIVWVAAMNFVRAYEVRTEDRVVRTERAPRYGYEYYEEEEDEDMERPRRVERRETTRRRRSR